MSKMIEEQLGKKQGREDWIVYRATGYNPLTKELTVYVHAIGDSRWHRYLDVDKTYTFECREDSEGVDPLTLWELPTNQKKWVEDAHLAIPEYDLVLPQIFIYFWHKDSKLSIEWDW